MGILFYISNVTRDVTDSEAKAPIIVPLSRKVGIRATTPIAQSWRSVGWPARTGPEAWLLGAGGASSACHPEAVSAAFTAAVEWRLMIEANTCTTQWRIGVGNGKLERISKKLDQISQKLEPN